jgi:hypothetical protein
MLDDTPRQTPIEPSSPVPIDPVLPDRPGTMPADDGAQNEVTTATVQPTMTGSSGTTPAAAPEASGAALLAADVRGAWSGLEPTARLLFGASAAAFLVVLVGLPLSVWDSAPFALLVMAAAIVTAVTAWFGSNAAWRSLPIPRTTIELMATLVVTVLAVFKLVEVLFDLDTDGIVGLVVAGALVAAAAALMVAARRRGVDSAGALMRGDQGSRIAAIGFALVLLGWAFNLSISFWSMGGAALPLAVMTLAVLTVAEAPRIQSPVPVAWIGTGIAVFGALLALGHWGELTALGRTEIELEPFDFLGLVAWSVGVAFIIAGGVLSGRAAWAASHPAAPGPIPEG